MMTSLWAIVYVLSADPASYPKAQLLMEAAELAKPGTVGKYFLIDVRGPEAYTEGHIPGAIRVPLSTWSRLYNTGMTDAAYWKAEMAAIGITPTKPIVIYGATDLRESCRLWWLLGRAGVSNVQVLNGGYKEYVTQKGSVEQTPTPLKAAPPHDWKLAPEAHASKQDVVKMLAEKKVLLLDARSLEEYESGRIPGAVHLEWEDFLTEDKMRFKSHAKLKELLELKKVNPTDPLCTYCQSGGRASVVAFGLALMGSDTTRNYYKSYSEWSADTTLPKERKK
ncbi:MAG: sulfurtransferase [Gemmataceae bacterium]